MINRAGNTAALMLTAMFVITSCGGSGSTGTSLNPPRSTAPHPTAFTSASYGYTVTLPPGWHSTQAAQRWSVHDGYGLDRDSFQADQFRSPSEDVASFSVADHWKRDLAAWARYWITVTANYHEHCSPPLIRKHVTIGDQPGVLLGYNCGILINIASTVRRGIGYAFFFSDYRVQAPTDPTDDATFLTMMRSVQFPN